MCCLKAHFRFSSNSTTRNCLFAWTFLQKFRGISLQRMYCLSWPEQLHLSYLSRFLCLRNRALLWPIEPLISARWSLMISTLSESLSVYGETSTGSKPFLAKYCKAFPSLVIIGWTPRCNRPAVVDLPEQTTHTIWRSAGGALRART